ncbi:MAG TPA: SRPBCC domain-containing protein [Rhizomicrobium sp.]|nr:SRPBCC domain-containing protein [Rhizomicrobium sp.]
MVLQASRPARRHLLLGVIASSSLFNRGALAAPPGDKSTIHQEDDFTAPPHRVYAVLTEEKAFADATGAPAKIAISEGGAFSLFGGAIVGRNIELVPDQRVVQAWRDSAWGPGVYSVARFELSAAGPGTHLVFDQGGYPVSDYASLVSGWHSHYWEPMKKYFAK